MEVGFLYWTALKVFGTLTVIGTFVWYFYNYIKKHDKFPSNPIPYILAVVLLLISSYGMIKINPPETQQRTIMTYDTQEVYEVPEIELQTKQHYQPELEK